MLVKSRSCIVWWMLVVSTVHKLYNLVPDDPPKEMTKIKYWIAMHADHNIYNREWKMNCDNCPTDQQLSWIVANSEVVEILCVIDSYHWDYLVGDNSDKQAFLFFSSLIFAKIALFTIGNSWWDKGEDVSIQNLATTVCPYHPWLRGDIHRESIKVKLWFRLAHSIHWSRLIKLF